MSDEPIIDWTPHHAFTEQTITCRCGAIYRSHAKLASVGVSFTLVTEKPCPSCGEKIGNARGAASDPESMTI